MIALVLLFLAGAQSDDLHYDPQLASRRALRAWQNNTAAQVDATRIWMANTCVQRKVGLKLAQGYQSRSVIAEDVADSCAPYFAQSRTYAGKLAKPAALARARREVDRQAPAGQR